MRLLFIIILIPFFGITQIEMNKFHVYGKYSCGKIDSAFYNSVSFTGEYMIHKKIGLNYNLDFTHRNDNIFQFHTSMGSVAGPLLFVVFASNVAGILNSSGSRFAVAVLACVLPDGVSFHIPYRYRWDFSPYINFLGFDYVRYKQTGTQAFKYSSSFGFKTSYWFNNNLTLTSFIETRKTRSMGWGIGAGVGIGYTFKAREE